MSELLSKSFSELKVTTPQSTRIQIDLPDLPTDGRVCFYGYDVGMEWFVNYSTTHWSIRNWGGIEQYDDHAKVGAGMHLLRAHVGLKGLEFESALKDHTAPSGTVTIPGHRLGEIRVPLLSIFSNEVSSFKRRPSQEQVDRLSQIMGKQPRWWVDYEDPRSYEY